MRDGVGNQPSDDAARVENGELPNQAGEPHVLSRVGLAVKEATYRIEGDIPVNTVNDCIQLQVKHREEQGEESEYAAAKYETS